MNKVRVVTRLDLSFCKVRALDTCVQQVPFVSCLDLQKETHQEDKRAIYTL